MFYIAGSSMKTVSLSIDCKQIDLNFQLTVGTGALATSVIFKNAYFTLFMNH